MLQFHICRIILFLQITTLHDKVPHGLLLSSTQQTIHCSTFKTLHPSELQGFGSTLKQELTIFIAIYTIILYVSLTPINLQHCFTLYIPSPFVLFPVVLLSFQCHLHPSLPHLKSPVPIPLNLLLAVLLIYLVLLPSVACAKRVATRWWISKESYDQNLYSG